jgi:DNA helicase-2/ATP-dependent DNA helicase PcrA
VTQHPDLPFEQARNSEYMARLKARASIGAQVNVARSRNWVEPSGIKLPVGFSDHPLVGRIGFDAEDELLGRACYIGPTRLDDGNFQVVSWDAPVSQLFFGTGDEGFIVDGELAVRRTFDHRLSDIADVDDEWLKRVDPSPFDAGDLQVPAPSTPRAGRRTRRVSPDSQPSLPNNTVEPTGESVAEPPGEERSANRGRTHRHRDRETPDQRLAVMRSPETVLKKLAAPRSAALQSVLATLQPDQFDVVSRDPHVDLLIQGHPGTGKTVVAAYRAAYLVSAERKEAQAQAVLLVGPTSDYVTHVKGLVRPLDPEGRVVVTHIAEVLDRIVGLKSTWSGGIGGEHNDIDAHARQFAARAEMILRGAKTVHSGPTARRDHLEAVYSLIQSNGLPGQPVSDNLEDSAWMGRLPRFNEAVRMRRYLPLMAQITLAFQPVPFTDQFAHLLVDEAQDISPIEWNVLEQYLRPGGHWSLVGDMNQRRSDTTYATWSHISDHLGIGDGDEPLRPTVLRRGYRSTTPILQFADKLLPSSQRGATSIQFDGPRPGVEYVAGPDALFPKALEAARRLLKNYPTGTVAIITVDPGRLIQLLGKDGWRRGETLNLWTRGDELLRVHVPESARGLEFDGVVVVEPGDFPENLGREGQLYTSLTRANRELAVVWHKGMPDALRKAARR